VDQVEIDIVNTELLQTGIKTLLDTFVVGIRELACDLQDPSPQIINQSVRGGPASTHEDLRSGYTGLTYTLSNVFLVVIQPSKQKLSSPSCRMALSNWQSSPSAIDMSIPTLQCMGNRVYGDLIRLELPSTYAGPTEIPSDPEFKRSAYSSYESKVNGSELTKSQSGDLVPIVQGDERDGHGGLGKRWKSATRRGLPAHRGNRRTRRGGWKRFRKGVQSPQSR